MKLKFFKSKKFIFVLIVVIILLSLFVYFSFYSRDKGFKINPVLFKFVIKRGEQVGGVLKITNLITEKNFRLNIRGLDLANLSEDTFILEPGEIKNIDVIFKPDYFKHAPGVYVGALLVKAGKEKEIPIIIEIQSEGAFFVTNLEVSPEYKQVRPGGKIVLGIKIFNLKDTNMHTLDMTYLINNLENEIIDSRAETIVVGAETITTKTMELPKDIPTGNYVFSVITKFRGEYGDLISTSSFLFSITKKREILKFNAENLSIIFSIIVVIFLFGIVILVIYVMHERDKLLLELRKQHMAEMKFYLGKIEEREKVRLRKAKKPKEKRRIKREFRKIKKKIVRKVREKQNIQKAIFKKLKKEKKTSEMKRKLEEWKKQGFNVSELSSIIGKAEKKGMKTQMHDWKKQGYDVSIFRK